MEQGTPIILRHLILEALGRLSQVGLELLGVLSRGKYGVLGRVGVGPGAPWHSPETQQQSRADRVSSSRCFMVRVLKMSPEAGSRSSGSQV